MVKISDVELPVIFKNQLLFKAGNWNHLSFSNDTVLKSVSNTKWSALNKRLYFKHENANDLSQWRGKVENIKVNLKDGVAEVRGDVQVWDPAEALQMAYGDKPHAISADIEYNDAGVMFFTGFALESDPGIRSNEMFLSDTVKNELSGYYHAKFSNIVDTSQAIVPNEEKKEEVIKQVEEKVEEVKEQIEPIKEETINDTQSAERRLINDKQTDNMTENNNEEKLVQPQSQVDKLVEKMEAAEVPIMTQPAKEEVKEVVTPEPVKVEEKVVEKVEEVKEVKEEGTVVDKQLSTEAPKPVLDETMVNTIVDKLSEKIKDSLPQPVTVNEFASEPVDSEDKTVNRLAESLAKM